MLNQWQYKSHEAPERLQQGTNAFWTVELMGRERDQIYVPEHLVQIDGNLAYGLCGVAMDPRGLPIQLAQVRQLSRASVGFA